MKTEDTALALCFYDGTGTDFQGRPLDQIVPKSIAGRRNRTGITRIPRGTFRLGRAMLAQSSYCILKGVTKAVPKTVSSDTTNFWSEAISCGGSRDVGTKTR